MGTYFKYNSLYFYFNLLEFDEMLHFLVTTRNGPNYLFEVKLILLIK